MKPRQLASGLAAAVLILACKAALSAADVVLTFAQITCAFNSAITNEAELAKVCGIAEPAIPLLKNLIAVREGAAKSGVCWDADAGTACRSSTLSADGGRP